ncbi:MAG TPA: FAD-dependent oxidoreductase [Solirubrobacteraceae bacterium]|jgi:NAD(P)H-nitrite reductase large subunit
MGFERVVIVGAGPAGLATARAYREHGGSGTVTLIGEEPLAPYRRPPLSKDFLRGELDARELPIERLDWFDARGIALRLGARVEMIAPRHDGVALASGEELSADAIVLATGSEPLRPPIPGAEDERVLTLRRLPDSRAIAAHARAGEHVVVVGTGFVGCELSASLALKGAEVTLIGRERLPQLERLGADAGERIAAWLTRLGVVLKMAASVAAIEQGQLVELDDGARIAASLVVLAAGVRPRGELAGSAGLETNEGAVVVDQEMRSAADGTVLAVGDLAFAHNASAGRHLRVEHWGDALEHGAVAGGTLAGATRSWREVPGFWSSIGARTLKYAAWGDGHEETRLSTAGEDDGSFAVHYLRDGATVGVLTHERDDVYEQGRELILQGEPPR